MSLFSGFAETRLLVLHGMKNTVSLHPLFLASLDKVYMIHDENLMQKCYGFYGLVAKWNASDIEQHFDDFNSRLIRIGHLHHVHFAINLTAKGFITLHGIFRNIHQITSEGKILFTFARFTSTRPAITHNKTVENLTISPHHNKLVSGSNY